MGKPVIPAPVKLFTGVLVSDESLLPNVRRILEREFGTFDYGSRDFPFDATDYYQKEMGPVIRRFFWSFERLIDPGCLPRVKLFTNRLEEQFSQKGNQRRVNLDPGYIDFYKLVLASVKERGQKIYLSQGIYADPVLYYLKGCWYAYEWALPDFRTPVYYSVFQEIRDIYRKQMRDVRLEDINFEGF
jgi:hypothetical protein